VTLMICVYDSSFFTSFPHGLWESVGGGSEVNFLYTMLERQDIFWLIYIAQSSQGRLTKTVTAAVQTWPP
jgi:hypothetical protein